MGLPSAALKQPWSFSVGAYRLTVLPVGQFALDGGAMFGVVPKTLWARLTPADEKNRIRLAQNCLLIEYEGQRLLLDSGIGNKFNPKFTEIYGIEPGGGIVPALAQVGLTPQDIDTVMLTHLHFDHAGGLTYLDTDNQLCPTFERATHLIAKGEWAHAHHPNLRDKASYLPENLDPLRDLGGLTLFEDSEIEILPGLKLVLTGGHTDYHHLLMLDRPEGGMIYWGDIIPTQHHLGLPFVMGYDLYPLETMAVKAQYLKQAFDRGWTSVFEHDPDCMAASLTYDASKDRFIIKPDEGIEGS